MAERKSDRQRFADKVVQASDGSGCTLYTGHVNASGYGIFGYQRKTWLAHRAALILSGHPLLSWQCVRQRCGVRLCVNPEHLQVCSKAEINRAGLAVTHAKVAARRRAAREAAPPPPPKPRQVWPERRCTVCQATLVGIKRRRKYCSVFCRRVDKTPDKPRLCKVCEVPLVWRFNKKQRKTCSAACQLAGMRRSRVARPVRHAACRCCGARFVQPYCSPSRTKRTTCSKACAARVGHVKARARSKRKS